MNTMLAIYIVTGIIAFLLSMSVLLVISGISMIAIELVERFIRSIRRKRLHRKSPKHFDQKSVMGNSSIKFFD